MTPEEYDAKFKSRAPLSEEIIVGAEEGNWKPKVTVINSSHDEMYQQEMSTLQAGGADYGGREQITSFMTGLRRLCGG